MSLFNNSLKVLILAKCLLLNNLIKINKMIRCVSEKRGYRRISLELRSQLVFRTLVLQHTVLKASRALKINYPAAKMIVQKRREEYNDTARESNTSPLDFSMYSEEMQHRFLISGSSKKPKLKSYRQMIEELKV